MLDSTLALRLAARLTVVKEFPRNPEAIDAVAEDFIDLTLDCEPDEAERRVRLITEEIRRTWTQWSTQAELVGLYQRKFGKPREIKSEDNEVKNYGEKPKVECRICNDTGVVRFAPNGPFDWCECDAGIRLHFDLPDWLNLVNRVQPMKEPPPVIGPHPAAQRPVSAEIERAITVNEKCPACSEVRPHSHSEFWNYHTSQETAA